MNDRTSVSASPRLGPRFYTTSSPPSPSTSRLSRLGLNLNLQLSIGSPAKAHNRSNSSSNSFPSYANDSNSNSRQPVVPAFQSPHRDDPLSSASPISPSSIATSPLNTSPVKEQGQGWKSLLGFGQLSPVRSRKKRQQQQQQQQRQFLSRYEHKREGSDNSNTNTATGSNSFSTREDKSREDWYLAYNGLYEEPITNSNLLNIGENMNVDMDLGMPVRMGRGKEREMEKVVNNSNGWANGHAGDTRARTKGKTDGGGGGGNTGVHFGDEDREFEERGRPRSRDMSSMLVSPSRVSGNRFSHQNHTHQHRSSRSSKYAYASPTSPSSTSSNNGPSFLNLDLVQSGIGESPVPVQRRQQQIQSTPSIISSRGSHYESPIRRGGYTHAGSGAGSGGSKSRPASAGGNSSSAGGGVGLSNHRGSFASFWTFGRDGGSSSSKKGAGSVKGKTSFETPAMQAMSSDRERERERGWSLGFGLRSKGSMSVLSDRERERERERDGMTGRPSTSTMYTTYTHSSTAGDGLMKGRDRAVTVSNPVVGISTGPGNETLQIPRTTAFVGVGVGSSRDATIGGRQRANTTQATGHGTGVNVIQLPSSNVDAGYTRRHPYALAEAAASRSRQASSSSGFGAARMPVPIPHTAPPFPYDPHGHDHDGLVPPLVTLTTPSTPSPHPSRLGTLRGVTVGGSGSGVPPYLRNSSTHSLLKSSFSVPNLRAQSSSKALEEQERLRSGLGALGAPTGTMGTATQQSYPRPSTAQQKGSGNNSVIEKLLSAESWCDALIFPRPRFRAKAAHLITPPESPTRTQFGLAPSIVSWAATGEGVEGRGVVEGMGTGVGYGSARPSADGPSLEKQVQKKFSIRSLREKAASPVRALSTLAGPSNPNSNSNSNANANMNTIAPVAGPSRAPQISPLDLGQTKARAPRPKSFAQDDLALLSPAPSTTQVLKDGDTLEKERAQWQAAASHSFANKRSRSLSRSRIRSISQRHVHTKRGKNKERERLESDSIHGLDLFKSEVFHGTQARTPTVSFAVPKSNAGTNTATGTFTGTASMTHETGTFLGTASSAGHSHSHSQSHSRKSSGGSQAAGGFIKGHAIKDSIGRTASVFKHAKQTAAGAAALCAPGSSKNDKADAMERALSGNTTQVLRFEDMEKKRENTAGNTGDVLNITADMRSADRLSPSRISPTPSAMTPSSSSHENYVYGIAVSTPTAMGFTSSEQEEPIYFRDHPFANTGVTSPRAALRGADYAGPHPSSPHLDELKLADVGVTDVSLRHRLPPRANPEPQGIHHPYSATSRLAPGYEANSNSSSRPNLHLTVEVSSHSHATAGPSAPTPSPGSRMYAEVNSKIREVRAEDLRYSPFVSTPDGPHPNRDSTALNVADVLGLRVRRSVLLGDEIEAQQEKARMEVQNEPVPDLPILEHTKSRLEEMEIQVHEANGTIRGASEEDDEDTIPFHDSATLPPLASSQLVTSDPPTPIADIRQSSSSTTSSMSPSPHPFPTYDEEDGYSDLFYRPGHSAQSSSIRSPRDLGNLSFEAHSSGALSSIPTRRGLRELQRQLSREYSSVVANSSQGDEQEQDDRDETIRIGVVNASASLSPSYGSPLTSPDEMAESTSMVFPSAQPTTPGEALPLRLMTSGARGSDADPSTLIPEDIESSRASSELEYSPGVEESQGIHYRLGEVPALATPNPIDGDGSRRHSARVSFHGDTDWASPNEILTSPEHATHVSSELLSPAAARMSLSPTDLLRQSYVTTTSSTSRISQLSDFPVPPGQQQVVTPASLIQSYFDDLPRSQQPNTFASDQPGTSPASVSEIRRQRLLSHRTTFGTETSMTEDLSDLAEDATEV